MKTKSKQQAVPIPFYFFGLKHCGKSTLGRITAQAFSMNFLDADDILNNFLSKKPNYKSMSIRELYHTKGKQKFQEYEYQSMVENLEYKIAISDSSFSKSINTIYALGGGACDNTPLLQFLKQTLGTFFYIKQDEKVLLNRILQNGIPPFLDNKNPEGSFHKLFTARSKIYEEQADHIIDISGKQPIEDSVRMITTYLKKLNL